jgi:hypothetical protein
VIYTVNLRLKMLVVKNTPAYYAGHLWRNVL